MRRKNTEALSEVIDRYLKAMHVDKRLKEMKVVNHWSDFVGGNIARTTRHLFFDNGVLVVQLQSSVVRNELQMIREPLRQKINQMLGEEIVRDIVLR